MGGSLPERSEEGPLDDVQDPYSESPDSSATRRMSPLGIRSIVWTVWKRYLLNSDINRQLGVCHSVTEEDFWKTTGGIPLVYMEDVDSY